MSENTKVARAAWVIASATMLSRIFGYLRDMVIAFMFGAGPVADAFWVAFRIPNLLRRLFGEGSLTVSFIPVFTEYRSKEPEAEARKVSDIAFSLLSLILVLVTLLGILLAPWIIRVLGPGFGDSPDQFALAVKLLRIMFPYVFFVCLVALAMGVLNTLRHFFAPAFSPVILNVFMILGALVLSRFFEIPILGLAVGVVLAGIAQLAFQMPFLAKFKHFPRPNFRFNHPAIKRIGLMMIPAVIGLSVYNLNVLINSALASLVGKGAVTFLFYADRLMELPLGVFAIAFGTALMPTFSSQAGQKRYEEMASTLSFGLRMVFAIILPAMIGLILLRYPIISLLFERGKFDEAAVNGTAQALLFYCVGLWAFSSVRIIVMAFYSMKDFWTPVKVSLVAFVVNLLLAFCFIGPLDSNALPLVSRLAESMNLFGPMRHAGLALSTSIASMVQVMILVVILRGRLGRIGGREILKSGLKTALACVPMGVVVYLIGRYLAPGHGLGGLTMAAILAGAILAGVLVYAAAASALKSTEAAFVWESVLRRFGKKKA